ncbi:PLP-dependent aminotransferase family protein [Aquabacterium sp.]|uniref:MocR-like pyridoxine biosynthesis transcription factor PdxR n=1 Tax=Aquabacterium sp. TaxID=1872578 RepID=UPI003784D1E7
MEPNFALNLPAAEPGSRRLLASLHGALHEAIVNGRLAPGQRLPSTRDLARLAGVSRNTAIAAYERLASEGYVEAAGSAGTRVAPHAGRAAPAAARTASAVQAPWRANPWFAAGAEVWPAQAARRAAPALLALRTGVPSVQQFPFAVYRRLVARVLRQQAREPAAYADAQGQPALRHAIAAHVSAARAVACGADDVIVTAGAQQAFDLLARVLVTPRQTPVAMEDPGYPPLRAALAAAGARLVPVPVDDEGLRVDRLPRACRVICVTPSHQFPLGMAMSAARRRALLAAAAQRGAVVIEDDYDGEYRFTGRPLDALKTLDEDGRVFYVGTFSKTMFPDLRLGYIVAPAWARDALLRAKRIADSGQCRHTQDAVAAFIAEGHLLRHVRRMTRVYAERRQCLVDELQRQFGPQARVLPALAGLNLAVLLPEVSDTEPLAREAAALGVGIEPLSRYTARGRDPACGPGLVLGYGGIETRHIAEAVRRLRRACRRVT